MDSLQVAQHIIDSLQYSGMFDDTIGVKEGLVNIISEATKSQFFQGGALLAVIMGILVYLKNIPLWIINRIKRNSQYTVYIEGRTLLYDEFTEWFKSKYPKKFKNVSISIDVVAGKDVLRKERFKLNTAQNVDWNYLWYKGNFIFVEKSKQILENANNRDDRYLHSFTLYSFFSKKALTQLLEEIHSIVINHKENADIYHNSYGCWRRLEVKNTKTMDGIYFDGKEDLLKDVETFKRNSGHYERLGINPKRGYLFKGPPGNGKTTLALGLASYLDRDIYFVNLASIGKDNDFTELFGDIHQNSIIVFEDIDTFVKERFGNQDNIKVSFSTLLNSLGGIFEPKNCIIIMTTNHAELLDSALVRPGRVDRIYHLGNPTWKVVREFLDDFYKGGVCQFDTLMKEDEDFNISMSQIQDYCLQYSDNLDKVIDLLLESKENGKNKKE